MNRNPPADITAEKLPDPWLADSEWILKELAKVRETILRIPLHLNTTSDIKSAVDRVWALEQQLRYLLHLHREGQRDFAKQLGATEQTPDKASAKKDPKIVRMRA